jgi:hypothetical protein
VRQVLGVANIIFPCGAMYSGLIDPMACVKPGAHEPGYRSLRRHVSVGHFSGDDVSFTGYLGLFYG